MRGRGRQRSSGIFSGSSASTAAASVHFLGLQRVDGTRGFRYAVERIGDGSHQFNDALASGRRDRVKFEPALGGKCAQFIEMRAVRGGVKFRRHHHHRLFRERGTERGKLVLDNFKIVHRIAVSCSRWYRQDARSAASAPRASGSEFPSPTPSCAPSIKPGKSATTNVRPFPGAASGSAETTPRCGSSVVNGYAAIFGCAAEMREISVDFPAFGKPTRPTSASNFNSSRKWRSSPGRPSSCSRGA